MYIYIYIYIYTYMYILDASTPYYIHGIVKNTISLPHHTC